MIWQWEGLCFRVLDEGLVKDTLLEETIDGRTILEGYILIGNVPDTALVVAEPVLVELDDGEAPHL